MQVSAEVDLRLRPTGGDTLLALRDLLQPRLPEGTEVTEEADELVVRLTIPTLDV